MREARSIECSLTASFCLSARNPPFSTSPLLYFPTKTLFSVQMYLPNFLPKKREASGEEEHFLRASLPTRVGNSIMNIDCLSISGIEKSVTNNMYHLGYNMDGPTKYYFLILFQSR